MTVVTESINSSLGRLSVLQLAGLALVTYAVYSVVSKDCRLILEPYQPSSMSSGLRSAES